MDKRIVLVRDAALCSIPCRSVAETPRCCHTMLLSHPVAVTRGTRCRADWQVALNCIRVHLPQRTSPVSTYFGSSLINVRALFF